jgi:DNA-binding NarL/FixJ family response regulator
MDPGLIVLVVDSDGPASEIAQSLREKGHLVVTAMGLESALAALSALAPDLVLLRPGDPAAPGSDDEALSRLQQAAPDVPARLAGGPSPFTLPAGAPEPN